jgi:hypothetical protein
MSQYPPYSHTAEAAVTELKENSDVHGLGICDESHCMFCFAAKHQPEVFKARGHAKEEIAERGDK